MNDTLLPVILERKSIFSFSDKPLEDEKIRLLFEAAKWAPSSSNVQPWRFIYALKNEPEYYSMMFNLLDEGNKKWAFTAPFLGISIAEKIMEYKLKPNRFAFHDLGMAFGNLLMQATYMGLHVHPMGGYDVEKARSSLHIPERFEPGAMFAIGYKGNPENLSAELQKREEFRKRERKNPGEFLFKGSWGIKI